MILRSGEGVTSVADPDLHMGGGGGGGGRSSRTWHEVGGRSPKNMFRLFRPQFGLKIRGGPGPPGPSPGSATEPPSLKVTVLTFLGKMVK